MNYEMMASSGGSIRVFFRKRLGVVTSHKEAEDVSRAFALFQNYPNPFSPATIITFHIPSSTFFSLKVYDVSGREVRTLVNEVLDAGFKTMEFDGSNLSSGVYCYRLQADEFTQTKRMLLIR